MIDHHPQHSCALLQQKEIMRTCISACPVTALRWVILSLHITLTAFASPSQLTGQTLIDCGLTRASDDRRWLGDVHKEFTVRHSSSKSTVTPELILSSDPVPYRTGRMSSSGFSYIFQVSSGQKLIHLHFNPTLYIGFERTKDLFTVETGSFTLFSNFNASITADALAVNNLTKEYYRTVEETFYSATLSIHSGDTHAFINGTEIISVPESIPYSHTGDVGVKVVDGKSRVYIGKSIARKIVYRQNVKQVYVSSGDDLHGMFGMWVAVSDKKPNMADNFTWGVSVYLGFRYLVMFDFYDWGLKMAESGNNSFTFLYDHMVAENLGQNFMAVVGKSKGRRDLDGIKFTDFSDILSVLVEGYYVPFLYDHMVAENLGQNFTAVVGKSEGRRDLDGIKFMNFSSILSDLPDLVEGNFVPLCLEIPFPPPRDFPSLCMENWIWILGHRDAVATIVIVTLCLVNTIVHVLCICFEETLPGEDNQPTPRAIQTCRIFSLAEIELATKNFSDKFVIGKGGFGKVYRGSINGSQVVAIKRLKLNSRQGKREFWTEIETLSELRHVNLVSLVGYCNEQQEMILVYEFMPNGTLADHLYKLARENSRFTSLTWEERLKICIGAGRGLDYLHTGKSVIHRDVKASNILLNEIFVPKVSDFGLAKMLRTEFVNELQSQDSTNLRGTIGYIDPDYFRTHKLTKKSDTYAFGVVLLEVLCGRPAVDPWIEADERSLTMWVRDKVSRDELNQIISPSLRGEILPSSLKAFLGIADRCLHEQPDRRPTIAHVVLNLEFALEQQKPRFSVPYDLASVRYLLPFTDAEDMVPCKVTNAASLLQYDDKILPENANLWLPHLDRMSTSTLQLTTTSSNKQNSTSAMQKLTNSRMVNAPYREDDGRSIKHNLSRLFPSLNRTLPSTSQLATASSREQNSTSAMQKQTKSRMVDAEPPYENKDGRKSVKHQLSQILPWKRAKISKDPQSFAILKSEPITKKISSGVSITNRKREQHREAGRNDMISSIRSFTFEELKVATSNVRPDLTLGEGDYGRVFKGLLGENSINEHGNKSAIAIKKLSNCGSQGFSEWLAEVYFLGRLSHPNLVKLLGYCSEGEARLLVYEFMEKHSLDIHLFRKGFAAQALPWTIRLKILTGAARGLAFLHSLDIPIIVGDVKTSNILLDKSYNAKLCDFGFARYAPSATETHVTTQVIGTRGCAAPEYLATGHLDAASDIYGFGVLLLEMLTGLRSIDRTRPYEQRSLVAWIRPDLNATKLANFVDSRLEGRYPPKSALQVYQLAMNCLKTERKARPSTNEVVETLEELKLAVEKPRVRFSSQIANPDPQ